MTFEGKFHNWRPAYRAAMRWAATTGRRYQVRRCPGSDGLWSAVEVGS